jgi:hypothetical protein
VASSPVHEDQTIDHMWVFLLLCLVPSSYSSVFILLPHTQNICEHYFITFYLVEWGFLFMPILHVSVFAASFGMCHLL